MSASPLIRRLIEALRCLPGVGPKSAQRIAYHLLERDRDGARHLAEALVSAADRIDHCRLCRTFSETPVCPICAGTKRDRSVLCVVESPADVQALEHSTGYQGLYFVLLGHLSPLDGIGPADIGIDRLESRLAEGEIREVILATNPTVEGEATAHYVGELVRAHGIRVTRLAHGIPLGGELDYVDSTTLSHAFHGRREL